MSGERATRFFFTSENTDIANQSVDTSFFTSEKKSYDQSAGFSNAKRLFLSKREWSKRANTPYMTLFSWKLFSIHSWFCVILRGYFKDCYLIGRLEWRYVILNLAGNFTADHAQQAIRRANLALLSTTSQKISTWNSLARVAAEEQNGPGFWEFSRESDPDSTKTAHWGLHYIWI